MPIDPQRVRLIFDESLKRLLSREAGGLASGVSERNSCARMAMYMQTVSDENGLAGYFADAEYNRKQNGKVKTLLNGNYEVVTICCDLILHSRGAIIAEDNLIAVEMKKADRPAREKESDRTRLMTLTKASYDGVWSNDGVTQPEHVCGYVLGAFVQIDRGQRLCSVEYFSGGVSFDETRQTF